MKAQGYKIPSPARVQSDSEGGQLLLNFHYFDES